MRASRGCGPLSLPARQRCIHTSNWQWCVLGGPPGVAGVPCWALEIELSASSTPFCLMLCSDALWKGQCPISVTCWGAGQDERSYSVPGPGVGPRHVVSAGARARLSAFWGIGQGRWISGCSFSMGHPPGEIRNPCSIIPWHTWEREAYSWGRVWPKCPPPHRSRDP